MTLRRLRVFLHLLAAVLFVGTVAELLAVEHFADRLQLIPFALCGLGLLTQLAVWKRPNRGTVAALRVVMIAIVIGSVVGAYQHVQGNLEFVREIRPNATTRQLLRGAVTGGNPLLASGALAVAASLAVAATYARSAPAPVTTSVREGQPVTATGIAGGAERRFG